MRKIALDAIGAAEAPHHFLSVTKFGHSAIVSTKGNNDCHIILRGGDNGPNYSEKDVNDVCEELAKAGYKSHVMVDFSHANSCKQFKNNWMFVKTCAGKLLPVPIKFSV